ncbi:hypothetical protein [Methylobacterium sp. WL103]|uniref:hypothetical protein n=1 Tax=Methylobacterium sp. WL103 TaxID=2603891 RepID=UPI0011C81FDC|nr:hypothetical protein [Methylobacterium sp. WL103]
MLAKRWHRSPDGTPIETGYHVAAVYSVAEHPVASIFDTARVLDGIAADSRSCVIRGRPKPTCDRTGTRRLKAHFDDAAQSWSAHDFDSIDSPDWLDWRSEPAAAAAHLRSLLPVAFHDVTCWWSFTGSQGFKHGLRMRLVFWHDLPLTCAELKLWLGERQPEPSLPRSKWPKLYPVDAQLYSRVQQIFTAAPVLANGVPDPVPVRSGVLAGRTDMVPTPWPIVPRFGAPAVEAAAAQAAAVPRDHAGAGYAYHRGRIGDDGGGFHTPMLSAASAWVAEHGASTDPAPLLADLTAAAQSAVEGLGPDRCADVADRVANLPRMIEWIRGQQLATEKQRNAIGAPCTPVSTLPTLTLLEAEAALQKVVADAFARTRQFLEFGEFFYDPPRVGIGAGIGIGKTEAAIREAVRLVADRPGVRIAFAVPTHKTGDDIAARLNAAAGSRIAASWRGIGQPDPLQPGCSMCRVPELVGAVRRSGGGVRDVCGGPQRGWCRHNPRRPGVTPVEACGYRQQIGRGVAVWVIPHAMLAGAPPAGLPEFDMLVIDEAPWLSLLGGFDINAPVRIPIDDVVRRHVLGTPDCLATLVHASAADKLRTALAGQDGLLRRAPLVEAGLGVFAVRHSAGEVWRAGSKPEIRRELPQAEALAALNASLERTPPVATIARALRLIADFLASGQDVAPETLRIEHDAEGVRCLRLKWRSDIHSGWSAGPVLYLDATLVPELARLWLPALDVATEVRARETAVRRVQVIDRQNGKTGLVYKCEDASAAQMQHHRVRRIRRLIETLAFTFRGKGAAGGPDVVVVTYKGIVARLRADMPANVAFGNFNGTRGYDGWKSCAVVVVIGRPLPAQRDVATMAAVASGRRSDAAGLPYDVAAPSALTMRDGTGRRVTMARHPDGSIDVFRQQILSEVEQAEGRARGVRRSLQSPLLSIILTAHPTELPVDSAVAQDEILNSIGIAAHLAARGIVPGNSQDAAAVLADDFDGAGDRAAALRKRMSDAGCAGALERIVTGSGPLGFEPVSSLYRVLYTGNSQVRGEALEPAPECFSTFRAYRYRRADCRKSSVALIDIHRHAEPAAALAAVVGPLASFKRIAAPAWLIDAKARVTYDQPERWFPPAPSVFTTILGTDHCSRDAASLMLPVAEDILSVRRRGALVSMHFYGAPHGVPLILIRTAGASWPPGSGRSERKSVSLPAASVFSAEDIAAAVDVPWPSILDLMADIHAQERVRAVGFDRAAVEIITDRVGTRRLSTAVAGLSSRSDHNS